MSTVRGCDIFLGRRLGTGGIPTTDWSLLTEYKVEMLRKVSWKVV